MDTSYQYLKITARNKTADRLRAVGVKVSIAVAGICEDEFYRGQQGLRLETDQNTSQSSREVKGKDHTGPQFSSAERLERPRTSVASGRVHID